MNTDDFSEYYAYVPFWFWPVLWLSIRGLKVWEEQERAARGGVPGQYIMEVTWYGRIVIYYVSDRPLADDQWHEALVPLDLEALSLCPLIPGSTRDLPKTISHPDKDPGSSPGLSMATVHPQSQAPP